MLHNKCNPLLKFCFCLCLFVALVAAQAFAQEEDIITNPEDHFGHEIGADYILLNYTQLVDYWKKIAEESDRMRLVDIGKTEEGRTMWMAIITSPENHKNLNRYKEIAGRLALAEGLTDEEARELAKEGKSVVWIDGGLHATEIANAQSLVDMTYQMVSRNDRETLRFLNDVIFLTACSNPDGLELAANWYMRNEDPTKRSYRDIPRLYHKYVGHDNNRDSYMANMSETEGVNRILYREWFPQIVYNQHQTGPRGAVLFCAPFRDPPSYNMDPLVVLGIDRVGNAMHTRFAVEGKPGAVMRDEAGYSTWWNGCLRCTPYFHNMIGILTEINGSPTPMEIPFVPHFQLRGNNNVNPIEPQKWHFRQCIEYLITADRAVLDVASKHREDFLFNIYRMGKNSIQRGSRDSWTITPKRIAAAEKAIEKDKAEIFDERGRSQGAPLKYFNEFLRDPALRDPRGYIIPSDQADFLTATKFVNALIKAGVTVHRAASSFEVEGKTYPWGSYVIQAAQAFRPHIIDLFEPQDHPDDIPWPGAPPVPPYDNAGYTLALQMGVQFDRIFEGFEGPFEKIDGLAKPSAGNVIKPDAFGFLLSHQVNDAFIAINRLLASDEQVFWLKSPTEIKGVSYPAGTIYIPAQGSTMDKLQMMADEIGLQFDSIDSKPSGEAYRLKPVSIGLWDRYGGSMPSGWIRWLLEQNEFEFEQVFPETLDTGGLIDKYDVLVFVSGAIPQEDKEPRDQPDPESIPAEWRDRLGNITVSKTVPELRQFLNEGGTILTIGNSANLGYHLNLPFSNALIEASTGQPLPREKFFAPGSIHQVRVDTLNPLAYGLPEKLDVFFNRSPVFKLKPGANMKEVAWYELDNPLRSGWLWGHPYLRDGITVIDADVGKGKLFMFGPEITNRAQPHGTFKFLFNGIYYGSAETVEF